MALTILHAATAAAVAAATSQLGQCEALVSAWADGNVRARIYGGVTALRRLTIGPWTIDETGTRTVLSGAAVDDTALATGTPTRVVFELLDGTEIFSLTAAVTSGGDINFAGAIKTACRPTLALQIAADTALPAFDVPAWMTAAVGEWAQISGTTAPSALKDFSGVAVRDDETGVTVYSALPGGHSGNYSDNSVSALELHDAAPAWTTLLAASDTTGTNLGTGGGGSGADIVMASDGHPVPRHTYTDIFWEPELGRVMVGGEAAGFNSEGSTVDHFGYDPVGNDWDAQGTWPDRPNYRAQAWVRDPVSGKRYAFYDTGTARQFYEWNPAATPSPTWTARTATGGSDYRNRGAYAWDSTRGKVYHLSGGGWFTQAAGYQSQVIDMAGLTRTDIGFNSSSAWTEFQANSGAFTYSALVYAQPEDCFYFYNGNTGDTDLVTPGQQPLTGQGAKVYKITPNNTATWDMDTVPVTGVTPATETGYSGAQNKFFYVPRWRTLFLIVGNQAVYYLRREAP